MKFAVTHCLVLAAVFHVSGSRSLESEGDSEIQVDTRPITPMMLACSSSRASLPTMSPPMTPHYVNSRTLERHRPRAADTLISSIVRSLHFADTFISDGLSHSATSSSHESDYLHFLHPSAELSVPA